MEETPKPQRLFWESEVERQLKIYKMKNALRKQLLRMKYWQLLLLSEQYRSRKQQKKAGR